ncbi:YIP1 family protein [Paenibacillus tarimensis]
MKRRREGLSMIIRRNRLRLFLSLLVLCTALLPATAYAGVKYNTYTKDSRGNLIWLQPAYFPTGVLGQNLYETDPDNPDMKISSPMRNPKDIFVGANNEIYVADTGNNRIVHMTRTGELIRYITLPESPLSKPEGLFVTKEGEIYIADPGNKRVVMLNKDGQLLKEFHKPESKFIPSGFVFEPGKVMVDERGFMYIAVHGAYEGLVRLDPNGKFQGFFGANETALSPLDALKRMLYTKKMYANEVPKKPETINSVATDENGYIYTVTGGTIKSKQLKKLNIKGNNLIRGGGTFGETVPWATAEGAPGTGPQLVDVAVDRSGNMIVVDQKYKYISHYDATGNLLYFWGGDSAVGSSQVGLLKSPVALDVNADNELFILDDQENIVQVFRLSEFGQKVDEANGLTLVGNYEASEKPWREVLRLNDQFTPAILGLAQAAFKNENYEESKALFKEAGNPDGFSEAFWQIRMLWFQRNFSLFATLIVIAAFLYFLIDKLTAKKDFRSRWRNRKRSTNKFIVSLRFIGHLLKHPIDGFSSLHYENKGGYWSAVFILIGVYASLVFSQFVTSFTFNTVTFVDIYNIFRQFFIVWIAWVLSNYLVSSIYRGEGRFRDIFIGSSYALLPYIVVGVPLAVLSNVMTLSEASIYAFMERGMLVWIVVLIFWKVQSIHSYTVGEAAMNIFLTLCTMLSIGVLVFITFGLTNDFVTLIYQMVQEVRLR